jgi:hypothetical protein
MESAPVEQYLLFDHTEYIKGIEHIGAIALIELIIEPIIQEEYEEPRDLPELLQPKAGKSDSLPRLFEI